MERARAALRHHSYWRFGDATELAARATPARVLANELKN